MLPVLPFDVTVPELVKAVALKARSDCKVRDPSLNWAIDAVGSGVADDPAHVRARPANMPELLKDQTNVAAIGRNHRVIMFLASMAFSNFRQLFHNARQFGTNWGNSL